MDNLLRDRATIIRRLWVAAEALLVGAAFVAAYALRDRVVTFGGSGDPSLFPFYRYLPIGLLGTALWSSVSFFYRDYYTQRLRTVGDQWVGAARTSLVTFTVLAAVVWTANADWLSRGLIAIFLLLAFLLVGIERTCLHALRYRTRRAGRDRRFAVLIGAGSGANQLLESLRSNPQWGLEFVGRLSVGEDVPDGAAGALPQLGTLDDLEAVLDERIIDEIVVSVPPRRLAVLATAVAVAEVRGVNVRLLADFAELQIARTEIGDVDGMPVLTFTTLPHRATELLLKRVLDIVLTIALAPLVVPFALVAALTLRLCETRAPLFRQTRVGKNGRRFTLYKFRTMRDEPLLDSDRKRLNTMTPPVFKANPDPRVTRIGRLLRRWSLDEVPQLWNVLVGEMSLVGPRPPLPEEVEGYADWQLRRLSMKPGMTGLWQVSGRNRIDFDEWVALDLRYIDQWSIWLDLRILLATVGVVIRGDGH